MASIKTIASRIITEGKEREFTYKGNTIGVEAEVERNEARTLAAQVFKALKNVKGLQGKAFTLTLELEEEPEGEEAPKAPEESEPEEGTEGAEEKE